MTQQSISKIDRLLAARIYIDPEQCTGCGLCAEICPFGLPLETADNKYIISYPDHCTGCSACSRNCPVEAISVREQSGCGCLWDVRARKKVDNDCSQTDNIRPTCCG